MQPNLNISVEPVTDHYQVVHLQGEFDKAGFALIKEKLDDCVMKFTAKELVFDFSALKFINSEGIGCLMEIHTHLVKLDKKLVLIGVNPNVEDVFKAIGIDVIVPIYKDLAAFLNK